MRLLFSILCAMMGLTLLAEGTRIEAHPGEIRAVWDHFSTGLVKGDWSITAAKLKAAGITDIYLNVAGPGFAHYKSRVLPTSLTYSRNGDQLSACLAAAKPLGMRVHAWVMCFSAGRAPEALRNEFARRGWCLKGERGEDTYLLDPSNPEVRQMLIDAVAELSANYAVDGIHLDYVRWRDFPSTLRTPAAMERFALDTLGADPEREKEKLFDWRARQIDGFVAAARRVALNRRANLILSAAVYGKYPSCVNAVGQDWKSWLDTGMVEFAVPMDYTEKHERFEEWTREQGDTKTHAMHVIAGVGVTAYESHLEPEGVAHQVGVTRNRGLAGFALFDLDEELDRKILPVMSK